jgi:tRNA pseudouridine55 synthase
MTIEQIDELAKTPELDAKLLPVELGLEDLPQLKATPEGAVRLKNGNPGMVLPGEAEWGDEVWVSFEGQPLAVGIYKSGEVHPSRVFNL